MEMKKLIKYFCVVAISLLPTSAFASSEEDLILVEMNSQIPSGSIIKSPTGLQVKCCYSLNAQTLVLSADSAGISNVLISDDTSGESINLNLVISPLQIIFLPLPHPGEYHIVATLSSGQIFWGILTL